MSSMNETIKLNRRSFLKMAALSSLASPLLARSETLREANVDELKEAYEGSQKIKSVCTACSVGCGIIAEVQNGVWLRQEIAQDHPVSSGGHCCKG
ncbi:formate dehydrogenase, partial [Campylobacter jejuni]